MSPIPLKRKKLHVHMFWLYQLRHIMSPISDLINTSEMSVMWKVLRQLHTWSILRKVVSLLNFLKRVRTSIMHIVTGLFEARIEFFFILVLVLLLFACVPKHNFIAENVHIGKSHFIFLRRRSRRNTIMMNGWISLWWLCVSRAIKICCTEEWVIPVRWERRLCTLCLLKGS